MTPRRKTLIISLILGSFVGAGIAASRALRPAPRASAVVGSMIGAAEEPSQSAAQSSATPAPTLSPTAPVASPPASDPSASAPGSAVTAASPQAGPASAAPNLLWLDRIDFGRLANAAALEPALIRCDSGEPRACLQLVRAYRDGQLVAHDVSRSAHYQKLAYAMLVRRCHHRDADSCLLIAKMHREGLGLPRDERAIKALVERSRDLCQARQTELCRLAVSP